MESTAIKTSTIWWAVGGVAVLGLIMWFALRGSAPVPAVPNTGIDESATTTPVDSFGYPLDTKG